MRQIRAASKLIRRKQRQYETQNLQFVEMREDAGLKEYPGPHHIHQQGR